MRKRDIQSFTLKLSDMKEYEEMRVERAMKRAGEDPKANEGQNIVICETVVPSGYAGAGADSLKVPLVKIGPRRRAEVRGRLGLSDT